MTDERLAEIKRMYEDVAGYQLDGYTGDYAQSIDRDQAIDDSTGQACYDGYRLIEIATGTCYTVSAADMEGFARIW